MIIMATLVMTMLIMAMITASMITATITTSTTSIAATITRTAMRTSMSTSRAPETTSAAPLSAEQSASLYRLMTWLSPAFPVGAFSYSSGLEWAVEAGDVIDAPSLRDWLTAMLEHGAGFCDGVFLAHAYRAVAAADETALRHVAELATAFVPSAERHLETTAQGKAFIEIVRNAWPSDGLACAVDACAGALAYPVAVGLVSATHGVPLAATLHAFLHAVVSNWISAGARLVPLGQTDSQRVLAALEPAVIAAGDRAREASLDDLGSATFRADLASLRHETQYTRLFRS
ncbi:Urease accessory protein UreF [Rhodopseudomonas palustris BisB5]|nr:Urease accessory protein UreF [Rhodopseudomonas palustris BisB5]